MSDLPKNERASNPTTAETALSGSLIAGAFAAMTGLSSTSVNLLDKVSACGEWMIGFVVVGNSLLLISIIFGGRGIAYGPRTGPRNNYNWQAIAGALGALALLAAPVLGALHLKVSAPDPRDIRISALERHIDAIQARSDAHDVAFESKIEKLLVAIEALEASTKPKLSGNTPHRHGHHHGSNSLSQ